MLNYLKILNIDYNINKRRKYQFDESFIIILSAKT